MRREIIYFIYKVSKKIWSLSFFLMTFGSLLAYAGLLVALTAITKSIPYADLVLGIAWYTCGIWGAMRIGALGKEIEIEKDIYKEHLEIFNSNKSNHEQKESAAMGLLKCKDISDDVIQEIIKSTQPSSLVSDLALELFSKRKEVRPTRLFPR